MAVLSFTAAQAAQKEEEVEQIVDEKFTAAQAAQKSCAVHRQ